MLNASRSHLAGFAFVCLAIAAVQGEIILGPAPGAPAAATPEQQAIALRQQAAKWVADGRAADAVQALEKCLQIVQGKYGANSLEASTIGMDLAVALREIARYEDAVKQGERAVVIRQKFGDKTSLDYALAVQNLGEMYLDVGHSEEAYNAFNTSNPLLQQHLPERDLRRVTGLHDLGTAEQETGRPGAEEHLKQALALREELLGKDTIPVAFTTGMLARCHRARQDYASALKLQQRATEIFRHHQPASNPMLVRALADIAAFSLDTNELATCESAILEGETLLKTFASPSHALFGTLSSHHARLYEKRGQLAEAEACLLQSLDIAQHLPGPPQRSLAYDHRYLGDFYARVEAITKAEEHYRESVRVAEEIEGPNSLIAATTLIQMGSFLVRAKSNLSEGKECMIRAANIMRTLGQEYPIEATIGLARLWHSEGRSDEAAALLRPVLTKMERTGMRATSAYENAQLLLQGCERSATYDADRIKRLQTSLRSFDEGKGTLPKDHPDTISTMESLTRLLLIAARPMEAEPWATRALALARKHFSRSHNTYRACLESCLWAKRDLHQDDELAALSAEWEAAENARLETVLATTSASERIEWIVNEWPYEVPASLGRADITAAMLLHTKGLVFELDLADRMVAEHQQTPEGQTTWQKLTSLRSQLGEAVNMRRSNDTIKGLVEQVATLEQSLAGQNHRGGLVQERLRTNVNQVQAALSPDAAMLDYFAYNHRERGGEWHPRYGLVVWKHNGPPELFECPQSLDDLNGMTALFATAMKRAPAKARDKDAALESFLQSFHNYLIGPAAKSLEGIKTLYICPDQQLQFVPFAVLLDAQGRFLSERFSIRYVTSACDLIATSEQKLPAPTERSITVFADANYRLGRLGMTPTLASTFESARNVDILSCRDSINIRPLPGTAREGDLIAQQAKAAQWKWQSFTGDQATEASLRGLDHPTVLHLATHGAFLRSTAAAIRNQRIAKENDTRHARHLGAYSADIRRSMVLLAGAEDSLNLWSKGYTLPRQNDGFFNAAEAAEINLHGTELVFLSACDTGAGESVGASGVLGLRTALLNAGARNVISTVWPIKDAETAEFVSIFYRHYFQTGNVATALDATQRDWLERVRKEQGLWEAIKQAGGFMLVSAGRQE